MAAQTSYSIDQPKAYAGLVYAQSPSDIVSRLVETPAGVEFGVAVSRGTNKESQVVVGGTEFAGITIRSLEREGEYQTGNIKYSATEPAGLIREGYVWLTCPAGCNPGDAVKYSNTTGIINSGNAGAGETRLDGAQWETTGAAGELAVVRLTGLNTTAGS